MRPQGVQPIDMDPNQVKGSAGIINEERKNKVKPSSYILPRNKLLNVIYGLSASISVILSIIFLKPSYLIVLPMIYLIDRIDILRRKSATSKRKSKSARNPVKEIL